MYKKSRLVNCFLFVLLFWIFIFVLFITWFSQGHSEMTPTCDEVLSNDIEETPEFRKTLSIKRSAVFPFLRQNYPNPAEVRNNNTDVDEPIFTKSSTFQFEISRRHTYEDVTDLWFYLNDKLKYLQQETIVELIQKNIQEILEFTAEHKNLILNDIDKIAQSGQVKKWRFKEHNYLSNLIQTRLHKLQNPRNCSTVKKIRCDLRMSCGFGCKIHHLVFCLIMAYGTRRTLIFSDEHWGYDEIDWNSLFQPISSCSYDETVNSQEWRNGKENSDGDFYLPLIGGMIPRPSFLPLSIPQELAPRLIRLHGDPIVWWIGQFLKYLMRPQSLLSSTIKTKEEKIMFKKPIVGVHIRRTDKIGTEADFHELKEYMDHVEEYFDYIEMKKGKLERKVYLATDDRNIFSEANKSYPTYTFLGDDDISESALPKNRQSVNSLIGIILDIYFLSKCDFLVCTFSSQVCRVSYELMQTRNPDAASNFRSLDDIYYFGGQHDHDYEVILPHVAKNEDEIDLEVGDRVHVAGNHWNGYSKGRVRRTNKVGLFPTYKTRNIIRVVDFPTFATYNEKFD